MNFLCLLPMVLKTRGLGTGATFMRGSYVAEPRLLAWLRERTVLVKSEHHVNSTTGSEYIQNIYIHLKLIFAFAAQSSLSKVRNNAVRTRGTCAVPSRQHPCRIHKPVLGTRCSSTVPCRKTCTNHVMIYTCMSLYITCSYIICDAMLCIINDVMIVLYWDADCHLVCKNSEG